ncbi:MAG: 30S ribosome-binding factor RbfA [Bacteroidetes bacterium]|nr:30S ribosome-binding factor RbfA [Bacteroidota bacterium]
MESKRQKQVGELIKRNMSIVLQQEGGYIYGTEPLVTVTNVKMSPDLGIAKVYLSVYNIEDKQNVILEVEEQNARVRQSLATRVRRHVRRVPEVSFYLDDTLDEMYRLNALFDHINEEE